MIKQGGVTHTLDEYSAILISGSDLLKHTRETHSLDICSVLSNLVCSNTKATHKLDMCSAIFINDSNLFKHWSNSLAGCMFSGSHQWFWSKKTLESDSQARHVFSLLISDSDLLKDWRATHTLHVVSLVVMICSKHQMQESDSQAGHVQPILISGPNQMLERLTLWRCVQRFLSVVLI